MGFSVPGAFFLKHHLMENNCQKKRAILLNKTLEPSCRLVKDSIIQVSGKNTIGSLGVRMASIGEQKLFASWAAGFRQKTKQNKTLLSIVAKKHNKRNINVISGVPMGNPSNHFISLLPGASKQFNK